MLNGLRPIRSEGGKQSEPIPAQFSFAQCLRGKSAMTDSVQFEIEPAEELYFVEIRNSTRKRIAKRGRPGTPQAGTWVSIVPGYTVEGIDEITVLFNGVVVH